ncbi:hypothetical protein J2X19_005068 [Rhodoferax ferrireducens]|uniref:Uncharacterized protein n=1 Tax=Rhodoferax ferrireducens TaxID=192843 RepID=A0ABU2CGA2_9BURK|nr:MULTISPECIES: hypothetical protein [Rhodoferax]MDR7380365.1 hypothetical protein [Rhodoferax ferrireducens]SDO95293.1 hypothetical protein SAMN05216303_102775 [Rhodoferax sp. OV413]
MLFSWFNAKEANRFGAELAQIFIEKIPLGTPRTDKKFAIKTQRALDQIALRTRQFQVSHTLNLYTRAKLANNFKWTLKDAGYESTYVEELTEWLVKRL